MSFTIQIGQLTGSASANDATTISEGLDYGQLACIQTVASLNPEYLNQFSSDVILDENGISYELLDNGLDIVLSVQRYDFGNSKWRPCNPVDQKYLPQVEDSTSLYFAPTTSPVYSKNKGTLVIFPKPSATENARATIVKSGAINDGNETIAYFPKALFPQVVRYAAMHCLIKRVGDMRDSLPTDLDDITVFDAITDVSLTFSVSSPLPVAITSAFSVSTSLPTLFAGPTTSLPDDFDISSSSLPSTFSVSSSLPSAVSISSSLPSDFSISEDLPSDLTVSMGLPNISVPTIGIGFADALSKAQALIDEGGMGGGEENETAQYWLLDEDPEMTGATLGVASQELQRAASELGRHQSASSNEFQRFSSEISKYGTELSKEQARVNQELQEYSADVQKEVSRISSAVSKYSTELQKEAQRLQAETTKFTTEMQEESAKSSAGIAVYSTAVQKESARISAQVSKYNTEVQEKSQTINSKLSTYSAEVQKEGTRIANEAQKFSTEAQKYQAELSKEQARISTITQEYTTNLGKKIQSYTTLIQKLNTDYQWLGQQLAAVKGMYNEGWQLFGAKVEDSSMRGRGGIAK